MQVARDVPAAADATPRGVFGPLKFEPPPKDGPGEDEAGSDSEPEPELETPPDVDEAGEVSRKRQLDRQLVGASLPNGSPAKRPRLSNGYENGADSATDPMEIDHHADNHAYPSPFEGEPAASPVPHTEGPEQSTQVDKIHELAPDTFFLELSGETCSQRSPARAKEIPIVLLCEWSSQDPSILAAAGTDALARIWTVARTPAPDSSPGHVNGASRPFKNLVENDLPETATVTAMAWNWHGTALALAVDAGQKARISVWSVDGTHVHRFDGQEPPVTKLRWCPDDSGILAIGPENNGTLVSVFSSSSSSSMSYFLEHDHGAEPLDATWITETEFVVCGGDLLISLQCTPHGIVAGRPFQTHEDEAFSQVQFDWRTKTLATSSDKGIIDVSVF